MKFPKPWCRKNRGWYVTLDGEQIPLGKERAEAMAAYHKLMQEPRQERKVSSLSVAVLIDRFLDHVEKNLASDTYVWYQSRLQCFVSRYPDLFLKDLKPFHVQEWIDDIDQSAGTKRNYARSIQRCLAWCEEMGHIERSPIAKFKKPGGGKRDKIISPVEYETILSFVRNDAFRDLLIVTWETGCRPQESLIVEARHVDIERCRWFIPKDEAKGRQHDRCVYLNDRALEITRKLMLAHPDGKLFRNSDGSDWTTDSVNCAFVLLQGRLGKRHVETQKTTRKRVSKDQKAAHLAELARQRKERNRLARKHGEKYCLYHFRHTWMNRLLTSGVDSLTVAILAGHVDASTLATTYQHLSQNSVFLLEQAKRAG